MHALCQNAGHRIRHCKFLAGKRMQRFLVDTSKTMPRRSAPTYRHRANMLAQASLRVSASAHLLGTRNPELLHAELQGRTLHSKPDSRAFRPAENPVGVGENRYNMLSLGLFKGFIIFGTF